MGVVTVSHVPIYQTTFRSFVRLLYRSGINNRSSTTLPDLTYWSCFPVYGELIAALQRLQHRLKENNAPSLAGLEGQLAAVQTVLLSPQFGRALSVCNKVREVTLSTEKQCLPSPQSWQAQELARDVRTAF